MTTFKTGDMWDRFGKVDLFCITVSGTFRADGSLVMGNGIAKEAGERISGIDQISGLRLREYFEIDRGVLPILHIINDQGNNQALGLFQIKHHWQLPASKELIKRSMIQLFAFILNHPKGGKLSVCLNFPGIGSGKLKREEVLPIINLLPDNVEVWELEFVIKEKDNEI
jgi:hypothetical protein